MKLAQLRHVVAIVQHGSLRAAARRLGQPQPAVTRSIRSLEKELGVSLFERGADGMTLTAEGHLFHRRATAIVREAEKAEEELHQNAGDDRGTVVVAMSIMPHVQVLDTALPAFRRRYGRVKLRLLEGLFPDVERHLRDGTIDLYIGALPGEMPAHGLATQILMTNDRTVLARAGHPLADAGRLAALAQAKWVMTSLDYNAELDLHRLFAAHDMGEPKILMQVRSTMSLISALAHSDLISLVPSQWTDDFVLTRGLLKRIPLTETLPAPPIGLVRRPDLPLTPAAQHFADLCVRAMPSSRAT